MAQGYYWHRFYSHQPDLNFDNPEVHKAVLRELDFWLGLGVDGLRLDAVPYLYEREGTNCENLPETHEFLRALRRHVDERFPDRMILAEANQWPEDAAAYFGAGDECHMAFYFPVMPRLFMGIRMEDRFPITDILEQTPAIPEVCQWALFLRNHDELTLEMVTDEERDYMYRVYAHDPKAKINLGIRRRLAPLLGNDRRRIELMNALLFSLSGTPVIYYGDEIGMGENIYLGDRNGVRTPMQWSADRNAGFSRANPQKLYLPVIIDPEYHAETINVEAQPNNPHSLLWWMRRMLALRKRHQAFGRGTLELLHPENRKVLAFLRRYGDETLLVVANLSRFVQHVSLDLPLFQGAVPVELFGQTEFPRLGSNPYFLSSGSARFLLVRPAARSGRGRDRGRRRFQRRSFTGGRRKLGKHSRAGRRRLPGRDSPGLSAAPALVPRPAKFHQVSPYHRGAGTDAAGRHPYRACPRRLQGPRIPCLRVAAGLCDRQPGRSDAELRRHRRSSPRSRSRITRNRASWLTPCRTGTSAWRCWTSWSDGAPSGGQAVNLSEFPRPGSRVSYKGTRLSSPTPRSNRATPR